MGNLDCPTSGSSPLLSSWCSWKFRIAKDSLTYSWVGHVQLRPLPLSYSCFLPFPFGLVDRFFFVIV